MRSGNRKKYLAIAIALTLVLQFSFFGSAKVSATEIVPSEPAAASQTIAAQDEQAVTIDENEDVPLAEAQTDDTTDAASTESTDEQIASEQVTPAPAGAEQEQAAASNDSEVPAKASVDQPEKQAAKAGSAKKPSGTKTIKADTKTITIKVGTLSKVFMDPELYLPTFPNNEVPYSIEGDLTDDERALLIDIITFTHGDSSTDGKAKFPNAGTYSLSVEDPEIIEASLPEGYTVNCSQGTLVITPMPVTVTIIGLNNTARYDGKIHHAGGFTIESSYSGYTRSKVELKEKYSKQANVNKRKPGKKMMGLKASMFRNNDPNYDVTFKKVVDGYVKVYPKDGPVPEPEEEDNNNGSNGSSNNGSNGNNGNGNGGYYDSNGNYVPYGNGNNGGYYDDNGNYVSYNDGNGNNNGNGNGTSEQADGQNGDDNGGTEAIDDNDTPKTDGSGTETIDDNDTPKTDGDEADDGSDTMPSMLPIILIILAIIAAFLLLLFSRKKRDNEQ